MSSTQGRGRARLYKPCGPLRKCGEFREPEIENGFQDDEKPPVQKLQQTVSEAGKSGTLQLAQGCQPSPNKNEQILSDWMQFEDYYHENLIEDGSTASSVNLDSDIDDDDNTEAGSMFGDEDDMTLQSEPTETAKKKCKQLKKCIDIKDADIVKFISNRSKYSQELGNKLEKLNAEVELVPEKSLIIVTKKPRSRYIKHWKKRCCSTVTKFCSRFRKNCFELKDSSSVRKALPRFGKMLQWSNVMYWIENNEMLVVMTEQSECEQVLKKVKEFLENDDTERKVEYSKPIKNQSEDKILLKAVNNPEFIPRAFQEPVRNFAPTSPISLTSAVIGPRLVPFKCVLRHEGVEDFINDRMKQLAEDPVLLDELSVFMANYLSARITVENDMIKVSDILFERCVSQQNIQYTGSKLVNYLDKYLVPKTTEQFAFRKAFLKRCSSENTRFGAVIHSNPERACNLAIFFGELLMNYKTAGGETITKFLNVIVSSIIKQLLQCHDKKLLICAGKLLKLTGRLFDQNDKMFVTIAQLANNPRVDKAVRILFNRVSELKNTNWGQHETLRSTAYPQPNACGAQVFTQNMDSMLEQHASDAPVFVEDEWSEYITDTGGQDEAELNEAFHHRRMYLEQNGPYVEEKKKPKEVVEFFQISSDHADYIERAQFLTTLKQCHPGMVEASLNQAKNKICVKGSKEAILVAKQQYQDLVKELNVVELPTEVMQLVSQKEGLEFINNRLSDRQIVYAIVVGAGKVKVVAQSAQLCEEVRECLCKNVRKATIDLPPESEHIFASKQWYEISKTIEVERLVDYQINFVDQRRHDIKLYGVSYLVKNHEKIITDFINSQKIECYTMYLSSGIARFMKEKLGDEIATIESDLREEQVKINILLEERTCKCKGTKEGIRRSKRRVLALSNEITPKSKDCSKIGICTLFFGENGKRNIKGIEAGSNVIIEISKEPNSMEKETTQAEMDAIQAERAQGKSKIRQATSMDPFDQCNFTTNEGLKVSWKYGNIAQERADILVSSAVRDLSNPAMVGRVMNSVGGPSFVAACRQHTNIGTGDIATTIGGNLLCQYVIHAVCCDWNSTGVAEQTLRRLLLKILQECTRLSASSVAMPLIGTGKRGFCEDLVLRVMREEFEKFSSMYPSRALKEIKLIRYDPGGRQTAVQAPPRSGSVYQMAPASNASSNTFVRLVAGSSGETVKLQVFGRTNNDISSAFDEIEKFIQNHLTSKTLNHEKHYDVVVNHWDELKLLTKDHDLRITCVDLTTVLIEGVLSKVVEAKDKLTELVRQYTNEERKSSQLSYIAQNVQWYYFDLGSREVPYNTQLNGTIELARMNGEATVEITEPDGEKYVVDFSRLVAKKASSGSFLQGILASYFPTKSDQTKKLTRKLIGSAASAGSELSLPLNWTPQPENQLVQLVQIAFSSQEYLEVQNHFVARGGNSSRLYKVERIQNPQLYSRYLAFRKSMRGQVNEMRLFHGTDATNVDSINAHNFSRSFAGVNGVAYGNGVYFARDASYSMNYASRQLSGSQPKMYMAKVLVGDYTRGAKGIKAPPLKNDPNNPGLRYDSVVDNTSNPSMYIIFQDNQYYPEYLFTMRY